MGKAWTILDRNHELNRYKSHIGKWQGRADYVFVPWLRRNLPSWRPLQTEENGVEEIQIQTNSSYIFAGRSLLGVIKWFLQETNKPFLFLTTTSSFVNLRALNDCLENYKKDTPVYAGNLMGEGTRKFVSGAGQLINRTTAHVILENFRLYPHRMLNDIALSELLYNKGIKSEHIPWCWLKSEEEAQRIQLEKFPNVFHFRVKTDTNPRSDATLMKILHYRLSDMNDKGILRY
jgi:hypothetical protein